MCFNRSNKIALTILSQLTITLANITENFEKENNKITSQNVRILKIILFLIFFFNKKITFDCAFCSPQWSSYCRLNFENF